MARRALHVLTLTAAAGAAVATTNRAAESDWGDAGEDVQPRSFEVHNPTGATVTEIHLVQSAHFDGGCKTFGCSARLVAGEPDRCAQHHAEPFAYHIVNRWLDQFFLDAVALSNATRNGSGLPHYRHMVQPWLLALLFDCERAGMRAWPGSGWSPIDSPTLHCPNSSTVAEVRAALQRGDLFFHAFPHDGEASAFPSASLFDAALDVAGGLSVDLGLPHPTAVSQRDVPGWTRAAIPLLARRGINGLSFGAGTPPGKPDTPPLFVWRDLPSGTEVVTTYESKYGDIHTVFVLPNGVALVADWNGDNTGPGSLADFLNDTATLQLQFPGAKVFSSTFDAFFAEANREEVKDQLPVVTAEIGDAWLYGVRPISVCQCASQTTLSWVPSDPLRSGLSQVPSDPLRNAMLREADRQRTSCIDSGRCDRNAPGMRAFDRLLVKVPEHTWGVASQVFMGDYDNWTNAQFDKARVSFPAFYNGSDKRGDYNTTVESWREQRTFITGAPRTLVSEQPELAKSLAAALAELQNVQLPSIRGLNPVVNPTTALFHCGGLEVGFDSRGALSTLVATADGRTGSMVRRGHDSQKGGGVRGGADMHLAGPANPLGLFEYQTFDNEDYNLFLADFTKRVNGSAYRACPAHYRPGTPDDLGCRNFRKPNVSSAAPLHRVLHPTLSDLWARVGDRSQDMNGTELPAPACTFVAELQMDHEAATIAGAPEKLIVGVNVSTSGAVTWDVVQVNKRPTRLPEAGFFSFRPMAAESATENWRLQVLGSEMEPADVLGSGEGNSAIYGGSPHLRGVESVSWSDEKVASRTQAAVGAGRPIGFTISSLDVPVISMGRANPFPTPRSAPPDMSHGVHFNIHQNLWNTNYILWYPFDENEKHIRSRFAMQVKYA